ncbi:hypothetical protein BKA70DRAFT_680172 [Coprinopsis sp. MPI-PUGE-AT-0042]|nr:hypothetical protein BKA70DRAFT_680172 [Coprinopsis sp. MPI-PUGE-AT-0042]
MTARATAILDDRDPQLTFAPLHGWSQQHIPDNCRGVGEGEQFIARVTDFARGGTWTTALATTGTSNITMEFRGTDVYAWFILFTRVANESNQGLPPENIGRLSFFLDGSEVDPAPLPFEHWWYTDFEQDSIVPNLLMLAQEDIAPERHTLTIQYSIEATEGEPQVVLAFDRVQYVPVAGFTTNLPSSSATVPTIPSSSSSFLSTSSANPTAGSERSEAPATMGTGTIVGISVGVFAFLLLVGSLILGLCWYRRRARRAEGTAIFRPTLSTDTFPIVHEQYADNITPFVSPTSGPVANPNRRTGTTTSSFGNMGALSTGPRYEKSSRPTLPLGAQAPAHQEPQSPQFSDQTGSPRQPVSSGKGSANRRYLVGPVSENEDSLTSSSSPTSGLSYAQHDARDYTTRPPSYRSEHP